MVVAMRRFVPLATACLFLIVRTLADAVVSSSVGSELVVASSELVVAGGGDAGAGVGLQGVCTWTSADGKRYDLTPLFINGGEYTGEDNYLSFRLNVCGPVTSTQCEQSSVCSFWKDDGTYHSQYGKWDGSPSPQWAYLEASAPTSGLQITLVNGKATCQGMVESVFLVLKCEPGKVALKTFAVSENFNKCTLTITLSTGAACPLSDSTGEGGGLSGGWVFIILLLVFVPLYIAGGCYWNHKKQGKSLGREACPHLEFWQQIPELAMAGCRYTVSKLQGLANRGSGDSYNKV